MGLAHYLFGFSGRINRAKQWAVLFVSLVQVTIVLILFSFTVGFAVFAEISQHRTTIAAAIATSQAHLFGILACVLYALGLYIALAVTTKRLHDRNKSAWWLLIFIILPLVLDVPAFLRLADTLHYLGAVLRAAQAHLPPPQQPLEPPLVIATRGIATIISLWAFVELYILRGTVGDNRFGPDPLAGRG
jgi:uncharacterized membrane protein YhaH (DUF805 family)